jgi:hypothetical protein
MNLMIFFKAKRKRTKNRRVIKHEQNERYSNRAVKTDSKQKQF